MKNSVRIFWRIFGIFVALLLVFLLLINYGLLGEMPSLAELENPSMLQATEIYANDGTLMGKYYLDRGNRSNVKYRDISRHVIDALVATEDHNFYDHSGIDAKGTMAIPFYLVLGKKKRFVYDYPAAGAQPVLASGPTTPLCGACKKVKEWIIAVKLERNFTKEEIIALYPQYRSLQAINVYGIRNASLTFFPERAGPAQRGRSGRAGGACSMAITCTIRA